MWYQTRKPKMIATLSSVEQFRLPSQGVVAEIPSLDHKPWGGYCCATRQSLREECSCFEF